MKKDEVPSIDLSNYVTKGNYNAFNITGSVKDNIMYIDKNSSLKINMFTYLKS